jgi:hypothetical protein
LSGSPTAIFSRARSSGVAPNFADRRRSSDAVEWSPSQNAMCRTAVSSRNDQSVSVNVDA